MRPVASRSIVAALTGALVLGLLPVGGAHAASSAKSQVATPAAATDTVTDFSARRRHYRGNGGAAALAAFGMIAGTIATIAANERRRDYYDRYGYGYYGYAPPPPPRPYYYGYGHRGYRYW